MLVGIWKAKKIEEIFKSPASKIKKSARQILTKIHFNLLS